MSQTINGLSINGVPLVIIGMAGLTTAILTYATISSAASDVSETVAQAAMPLSTGGASRKNRHANKRNKTHSKRRQ